MPRFGAHMSISGGIALAFDRLAEVEGEALQIFTANQRQWQPKIFLDPSEQQLCAAVHRRFGGFARRSGRLVRVHTVGGRNDA